MGLVDKGRMPAPLTKLFNTARSYSLWVYQWGLACCAIEMGAAFGSPRYDVMRLGVIPLPASPRQARPHWYTHIEYERLMLNSLVSGAGMRPRSIRPIAGALASRRRPGRRAGAR